MSRAGAPSGSFNAQQDTSLAPLLCPSSLGRCWDQSYATFQPHTQGTVTTRVVPTAGAEVGARSSRQSSFFPLTPTHVLAARLFVISRRNAPVGILTAAADLEGGSCK